VVNLSQHSLVVFLLGYPEKVLAELCEFLKYGSSSGIIRVILTYLYSGVDDLHYEGRVVSLLFEHYLLTVVIVLRQGQMVYYFYLVAENEVVLFVIDPVDLSDNLPHSRSPPRRRSLRVVI